MSWDHRTIGFEAMDAVLEMLKLTSIQHVIILKDEHVKTGYDYEMKPKVRLRKVVISDQNHKVKIAEEYLAIDDRDCDGTSCVKTALYPKGRKPRLITQVINN